MRLAEIGTLQGIKIDARTFAVHSQERPMSYAEDRLKEIAAESANARLIDMNTHTDVFRFVKRSGGGWLGISESTDGLRVGVAGATEEQTKVLLQHSVDRWRYLLQECD